ncbi:cytidine deaminase [Chryseobacterium chendengshani]|uniref:cytidine deaminase n=1 Tax=unclassified Chryseobacterium TaxID=2593645 RepID=UPI001C63FFEE|nr:MULTISPECIES: cytidine deaminase [unclassified Chryseobacterium]MBW7676728.1 cytidine deaminase [Chryseobacterium sp. LJ756]MBW8523271.1 cytidine deaminase [Chryseobacterium sp. LJ668]QYK15564.1 cytidine deaminase [Chryseobacterium sp. LJ668]
MKKDIHIDYEHFKSSSELNEVEKQLFEKAKTARENAYAPYSNFLVGCSVLLENDEIYTGNNQENAAFPSGLCAERTALFWIGANFPNEKIVKIFIIGGPREFSEKTPPIPPCGACRQSLMEYETKQNKNIEVYFSNLNEEVFKVKSIKDLLPFYFDSSFL